MTMRELDLAERLPIVIGDRIQVQQVLLNLVMNAFEAMEAVPLADHKLVIRTTLDDASAVYVAVQDAGAGFDEQDVEQLFMPFHTTKATGLGMGLAITRSIVEAHGGKIWASENADRGAHFTSPCPLSQTKKAKTDNVLYHRQEK